MSHPEPRPIGTEFLVDTPPPTLLGASGLGASGGHCTSNSPPHRHQAVYRVIEHAPCLDGRTGETFIGEIVRMLRWRVAPISEWQPDGQGDFSAVEHEPLPWSEWQQATATD